MKKNLSFRLWFYFRTGYGNYFAFLIALANMFTITYYLLLDNILSLDTLFPNFSSYVIISSVIMIPSLAFLGFVHIRKSHAYKSEADITNESHPYNYKLLPGIHSECLAPLYLALLRLGRKSLSDEKLTESEMIILKELQEKLTLLSKGGSLKIPDKFDNL